ncbi:helix-turn-helix transcriptional regulator [Salmonella enterica]|uniref:helix-turn-helix transcriptional regulator n=1 Tax=Salmonella enterica TaxID=28901 RepID=UPI0009034A94|nr:AlpA family transcriptional regulator [Salmonella enterica]
MNKSNVKILRLSTVIDKTGLSRSTIYDWINPKSPRYDPTFPKQRRLGLQSVGWIEAEIDEWILQRPRAIE